jgi:general secretion pathway protein L
VLNRCETNYDRAINMLRGSESPGAAIPQLSAVNVLAELTSRIPKDVPVTFDQIVIDPDRMTLRGTTDSNKQIDRVITALKAYRCFRDVKQGRVEAARNGGSNVTFHLDVQIACPEQVQAQG